MFKKSSLSNLETWRYTFFNIHSNHKCVTIIERESRVYILLIHMLSIQVIQGIDLIVALMDCHEISQVEVGPRFAYGSLGNGKDIPPEATILYTIELLEVSKETDLELVNIDERLRIG